jgi:hypothetical protein
MIAPLKVKAIDSMLSSKINNDLLHRWGHVDALVNLNAHEQLDKGSIDGVSHLFSVG